MRLTPLVLLALVGFGVGCNHPMAPSSPEDQAIPRGGGNGATGAKAHLEGKNSKDPTRQAGPIQSEEEIAAAARQAELDRTVSLAFISFEAKEPNIETGPFPGVFLYRFTVHNRGAKPIAGIEGSGVFQDMFDDDLARVGIKVEVPIAPGQQIPWETTSEFNPYYGEHLRFKNYPLDKLRFRFEPKTIIFADGTQISASGL